MQSAMTKSGFCVLVGRPSAGKSSLLNALIGRDVSIVSPLPQTTRNAIRGIVTDHRGQIVFLDTPGLHERNERINRRMRDVVTAGLGDADVVVYVIDCARSPGAEERAVAARVAACGKPTVVVLSKLDLPRADASRARAFLSERHLAVEAVVETRGLDRTDHPQGGQRRPTAAEPDRSGLDGVRDAILALLPVGPQLYPEEYYTDQDPRFRIAEVVRGAVIARTRQELPHAIFVEVVELTATPKALRARAQILVERESQKGIVVGRDGSGIRAIRQTAERDLGAIFERRVGVNLQVKVRPKWRRNEAILARVIG